jgi:hypothetical protein
MVIRVIGALILVFFAKHLAAGASAWYKKIGASAFEDAPMCLIIRAIGLFILFFEVRATIH